MKKVIVHLASTQGEDHDTKDDFTRIINYVGDCYPTDQCDYDYEIEDYERLTLRFYAGTEGEETIREWIPQVCSGFNFSVKKTESLDVDPDEWAEYCEENELELDEFED